MESAEIEASTNVVAIAILIYLAPENKREVTFMRNHENSTSPNQLLEMFISMKIDAECMKLLPRSHSLDVMKILTCSQNDVK